jgi:hypothetical protein
MVRDGVTRLRDGLVGVAGRRVGGVVVWRASDGGGICNGIGARASGGQYGAVNMRGGVGVEGVGDL